MTVLETALTGLTLGTPVTHANLTLFPLLGGDAGEPAYLTLGEALAAGQARVTEVSEQGSVPELRFVNEAARPVLLLDGEELVGAKQNRIVNLSILVPADERAGDPGLLRRGRALAPRVGGLRARPSARTSPGGARGRWRT